MEIISFTQEIKEEICSLIDLTTNQKKSILGAFIRTSGTLSIKNKKDILMLITENAKVAKFIYAIIKEMYTDIEISFSYRKSMKFYKATQYIINVNSGLLDIFKDLELNFLDDKIPYNLTNKEDKVKGYLEGLFLSCGTCNNPISSNYHLEFYVSEEALSKGILKLINKIKDVRFEFKTIKRRSNFVVYLKKSDEISSFLAYIDAFNSCLKFENVRMDRDFSNVTNRLMNCDAYNYKKSIEKAKEQIDDIELIDKNYGIKFLTNEKLALLCELRKKEPEATYQDLADMMSETLKVKVSKSNVNHLFIKLKQMAENYKNGD